MPPRTPFFSPTAYFERADRPSADLAVGLVLVDALATTALTWAFVRVLLDRVAIQPEAAADVRGTVDFLMPAVFLTVIVGYVAVSAVLHGLLWLADTDRGIGATMAVVGESAVVSLVTLPVTAAGLFLLIEQVPTNPDAAIAYLNRTRAQSELLMGAGFVTAIWQAVIQGYGLAVVHERPADDLLAAAIVVALVGFALSLA